MSRILSRQETAQALGVSLRTLDALIRDRRIDIFRVGSRVLIKQESVEAFIAGAAGLGAETTEAHDGETTQAA